jgi:hypothetical protein
MQDKCSIISVALSLVLWIRSSLQLKKVCTKEIKVFWEARYRNSSAYHSIVALTRRLCEDYTQLHYYLAQVHGYQHLDLRAA